MISFNCTRCEKPLILPNRAAGTQAVCPACGDALTVPDVPAPRPGRKLLVPLIVIALLGLALLAGWWGSQGRSDERFRAAVDERLHASSPDWQNIQWKQCDPKRREFQLTAECVAGTVLYRFELNRLHTQGHTFVRVIGDGGFLAQADFEDGGLKSFDYKGLGSAEETELKTHCRQLFDAVDQTR